jgi:hypothetical protein
MDTYIVIHTAVSGTSFVVRTTDWQVIAECETSTLAGQVADALNATV